MKQEKLKLIIEGALLAAGHPLSLDALLLLFDEKEMPERAAVRKAIEALQKDCTNRSYDIHQVASGYRAQVKADYTQWISRLWEERPGRYSRALLETIALIAYRQPITRGDIEDVRGVSVSTNIMRTLQERGWVKVVGHRDVPGRPAMFGTTREFLDYFGLKSLEELPTLSELRDIESINVELDFGDDESQESEEPAFAANDDEPQFEDEIDSDDSVADDVDR